MALKRRLILLVICLAAMLAVGIFFCYASYAKYEDVAEEYSTDKELTLAVMRAESSFKENAVSRKGAVGLMQLLPSTAEWLWDKECSGELTEERLFSPEVNVFLGAKYLDYLTEKFGVTFALAAYNAGEGTVRKWLDEGVEDVSDIPYRETKRYVRRVMLYYRLYKIFL